LVSRVPQNLNALAGNCVAALSDYWRLAMKLKKTVTPAKLAAQRENAQASTGPKSSRGKKNSSRSAITYGIFSADMLLPGETEETYNVMLNRMVSAHRPVGDCELSMVQEMSWCRWRLRRVYSAEAGETKIPIAALQPRPETVAHAAAEKRVKDEIARMEQIEAEIELHARVSTEDIEWLKKLIYGDPVKNFLRCVERLQKVETQMRPSPAGPEAHKNNPTTTENSDTRQSEWQNFTREALKREMKLLKEFLWHERMYHYQAHLDGIAAQSTALRVLPEAGVNRFSRYENHLTRKMLKVLHELERIQRHRQGEKVPPPPAS
jgi:hypothetical protein